MERFFQLPHLDYFQAGNGYSGSRKEFRYKIFNQKETLKVDIWYGRNCHEKSEMADSREFSVSEEGVRELLDWLEQESQKPAPGGAAQ